MSCVLNYNACRRAGALQISIIIIITIKQKLFSSETVRFLLKWFILFGNLFLYLPECPARMSVSLF